MQSLHSAITPPAPPAPRQLSKSPTSQQVGKSASRQVGKCPPYNAGEPPSVTWSVHHTPAFPSSPHLSARPPLVSRLNPPLCILHLAILFSYPAGKPKTRPPAPPALASSTVPAASHPPLALPRRSPYPAGRPNAAKRPTCRPYLRHPPSASRRAPEPHSLSSLTPG